MCGPGMDDPEWARKKFKHRSVKMFTKLWMHFLQNNFPRSVKMFTKLKMRLLKNDFLLRRWATFLENQCTDLSEILHTLLNILLLGPDGDFFSFLTFFFFLQYFFRFDKAFFSHLFGFFDLKLAPKGNRSYWGRHIS